MHKLEELVTQTKSPFLPKWAGLPKRSPIHSVRWWFIVLTILVWSALVNIDLLAKPGPNSILSSGLFCAATLVLRQSQTVHRIVMKPGRPFSEIRGLVNVNLAVTGFLFALACWFTFMLHHSAPAKF